MYGAEDPAQPSIALALLACSSLYDMSPMLLHHHTCKCTEPFRVELHDENELVILVFYLHKLQLELMYCMETALD